MNQLAVCLCLRLANTQVTCWSSTVCPRTTPRREEEEEQTAHARESMFARGHSRSSTICPPTSLQETKKTSHIAFSLQVPA